MFFVLSKLRFFILFVLVCCSLNSCTRKYEPIPVYNDSPITLSKSSSSAGMKLTITGGPFSSILSANVVTFNGVSAIVTKASSSYLEVAVPWSSPGPVKVVVNDMVAPNQPIFMYDYMSCDDFAQMTYSNFVLTALSSGAYQIEFDLTNTGVNDIDLYSTYIRSYLSDNAIFEKDEDKLVDDVSVYYSNPVKGYPPYYLSSNNTVHVIRTLYGRFDRNYIIVELCGFKYQGANCSGHEKYIVTEF